MQRRILVVPAGHREPVTPVCLGLVQALSEMRVNVAYAKPIAQEFSKGNEDQSVEVFRLVTRLRPPQPVTSDIAMRNYAMYGSDTMLSSVLFEMRDVLAHEAVVFEGLSPIRGTSLTNQFNEEFAVGVDADVLLVATAAEGLAEVVDHVAMAARPFTDRRPGRVIGVVIVGIQDDDKGLLGDVRRDLEARNLQVVAAVAHSPQLERLRVRDIVHQLRLTVVSEGDMDRRVEHMMIAAQGMPGVVDRTAEAGRFVITPGDRPDVLMTAALAEIKGVRPAGVLLTSGLLPSENVMSLCAPALEAGMPLLATDDFTYEAASAVNGIQMQIPADDEERAQLTKQTYAEAFSTEWLRSLQENEQPRRATYIQLRASVMERLGTKRYATALPGPVTVDMLRSARALLDFGMATCLFVGSTEQISEVAALHHIPMPDAAHIIDVASPAPEVVRYLAAKRGVEEQVAVRDLADPLTYSMVLLAMEEVQSVVGDRIDTGSDLVRLADELIGLSPGVTSVGTSTYLLDKESIQIYAGPAYGENATVEQIVISAELAADRAISLGIYPTVTFVSEGDCSTGTLELMTQCRDLLVTRRPDLAVAEPIQLKEFFDRPLEGGVRSGGGSVGNASILVFHSTEARKQALREAQRHVEGSQVGPLLNGYAKPFAGLPQRGGGPEITDTIGLTAVLTDRA
ncbi:phosphotransacetylase family protein [Dermatophilus congolensis]|uniref:phosphotransacetylase family protein n=1 Tax=Dermatophilus congolensis TaxID=1863 RepID=UPI001AAEAF8A|nr:phosphate acyltransferase [Dermatophilus congolensis]MBO3128473.1 AAA family ATPase [Dermatophilus congolensis]MBO3132889.1 AAA family ATPase [Dermatophilus congolensis]MBO3132952.1 AAA family ATPase [Dermatophilus congolensis]MBO3135189.1 AAA family ATPase [Dermatophilus congolensis]MBO3137425.1 AAA family ATPase [Dermatophilus congolensis]